MHSSEYDNEEKPVYCRECNGYLWSVSIYDEKPELVNCPYVKDDKGKCTVKYFQKLKN